MKGPRAAAREDMRHALMLARAVRFMFTLDGVEYTVVQSSIRGRLCSIATRFEGEGASRKVIVAAFFWGQPDQPTVERDIAASRGS